MTQHSEQINELAAALANAQKQFPDLKRDRTVGVTSKRTGAKYTFSYAPFERVIAAVRTPLSEHGLSFVQTIGHFVENGAPTLSTMLLHKSGQWIRDTAPLIAYGEGNQDFGSAVTYQKRYALTAILGLASDEDDDGNGADGNESHTEPPQQEPPRQQSPAPANGKEPKPQNVKGPYAAKWKFQCICGNTHEKDTMQYYWKDANDKYVHAAKACYIQQFGE